MTTVQAKRPKKKRINVQMLVFALAVIGPLGWVIYTFTKLAVGHGIEQVGEYKMVDLKAMGNFPFDDTSDTEAKVPPQYRALDGQKVLLIGEMYADFAAGGYADRFQLVYSIADCCFGGPPKVQERVFANAPEGQRVPIYGGLAKVYGTLHIKAIRENGKVVSLYEMDVERIQPN